MNEIIRKIDNIKSKIILLKLQDILLKEYSKGYYANAANVKERINLVEPYEREDGYTHYEQAILYRNGMYEFENINIKLISIGHTYNNKTKNKSK